MNKTLLLLCICLVFFLHNKVRGQGFVIVLSEQGTTASEPEYKNSELAKLMREIEVNFSAIKDLLGYSEYKEKHWKIILESAQNIREKTALMNQNFSRPDDWTYQELLESIQIVSNKIVTITKKYNKKKATEEVKLQIKALRQTCAKCHKHVDNILESGMTKYLLKDHLE